MKTNQIAIPAALASVIALHREMFGGWTMEADGDGSETPPDDTKASEFKDPETGETFAFPDKTPTKDMTPEQQAEYWRHKARKHEARATAASDYDAIKAERDQLKQAKMTPDEKAVEQARTEAEAAARADERTKLMGKVVKAELRGALAAKKIEAARITAALGPIDTSYFLTGDGEVDTDKVAVYADGFAPSGTQWPDTGQGNRGPHGSTKGVGAGRDLYHDRHNKK